jgi:copper chaperone NosL
MIGRRQRCLLVMLMTIALTACGKGTASIPAPAEITSEAVAEFCGMSLAEHPGPKAQIFLRGEARPHWFASVHDAFAYMMLLEQPGQVAAVYVSDMGKTKNWEQPEAGSWVEARKAVFVIESQRRGGMDENEAVPFSDRAAAVAFSSLYGGRLTSFADMPRSYILPGTGAGSRERDTGRNRLADTRKSSR